MLRQLERLARQQPVLMIFEDLNWIDPTSREFLDLVLARIDALPVLAAATFRLKFQAPWTGQPHVTVMSLNRLGRGDGAVMVERLVGKAALLPPDVIAEIVERTDGVPLFVEEMTKAVLEAGAERRRQIAASVPSMGLGVPATLQASLMARLDRLGPAVKGIAKIGAAIGRQFSYELAASVSELRVPHKTHRSVNPRKSRHENRMKPSAADRAGPHSMSDPTPRLRAPCAQLRGLAPGALTLIRELVWRLRKVLAGSRYEIINHPTLGYELTIAWGHTRVRSID